MPYNREQVTSGQLCCVARKKFDGATWREAQHNILSELHAYIVLELSR